MDPIGDRVQRAWERRLWRGRPALAARLLARDLAASYTLTDVRLTATGRRAPDDLLLQDIGDVARVESRLDRLFGTSTLVIRRRGRREAFVLRSIARGTELAALVDLAAAGQPLREDSVRAALAWAPDTAPGAGLALAGLVAVLITVFAITLTLHGRAATIAYAPDDPIAPNGQKRSEAEIARFMDTDVMPWARATLGPIVGGPDRVSCHTCHGADAEARGWRMPGVSALPQPAVVDGGWERNGTMTSQTRNAIYGYTAVEEKLPRARYMREHVLPGMARLLHRQAYDFTQPYEFNREHLAFGCYHCHLVTPPRPPAGGGPAASAAAPGRADAARAAREADASPRNARPSPRGAALSAARTPAPPPD